MGLNLGGKVSSGLKMASAVLALNLTPVVADQFSTSKNALMSAAEASESIKTVFTSEDAAAEYADDNGLKLVKDYHHNYGFVSPELAERQLLNREFVQVYSNGMIVLYKGFQGWNFTGAGDVTRVTIQKESNGGDKKPSGGGFDDDDDGDGIPNWLE